MKNILLMSLILVSFSSTVFADKCVMQIKRTACPGKETEAFKPYNGKQETEETKDTTALADCEKLAEKNSKIVRKGTLSAKTVTATFAGKALAKTYDGKADCK